MSSHADNPNAHHILPVSVYVKTLLVLFFLMALTIGAAEFSAANHVPTIAANIIAMTIAVVKATLAVMFFIDMSELHDFLDRYLQMDGIRDVRTQIVMSPYKGVPWTGL